MTRDGEFGTGIIGKGIDRHILVQRCAGRILIPALTGLKQPSLSAQVALLADLKLPFSR